jgi:hypothetical protein
MGEECVTGPCFANARLQSFDFIAVIVAAGHKVTHLGRSNIDPPLAWAGIMPACWEERT